MKNKAYTINITGLPVGVHSFPFDINDALFEEFAAEDIRHGQMEATVRVDKQRTHLLLTIHITGQVTVACDRCLDNLNVPVQHDGQLIVKYTTPDANDNEMLCDNEDILWIDAAQNELNLTQYFYDSIMISLPIQRIHAPGKCNREMTAKLKAMQAFDTKDNKNLPFDQLTGMLNNE